MYVRIALVHYLVVLCVVYNTMVQYVQHNRQVLVIWGVFDNPSCVLIPVFTTTLSPMRPNKILLKGFAQCSFGNSFDVM